MKDFVFNQDLVLFMIIACIFLIGIVYIFYKSAKTIRYKYHEFRDEKNYNVVISSLLALVFGVIQWCIMYFGGFLIEEDE